MKANQSQKRRVLQVVEPGIDGVFRHVEGLTHFLLETGDWHIGLAYSSVRDSDRLYRLVEQVRASEGHTIDLATGNCPEYRDIRACCRYVKILKEFKPDVIHAHSSKAGGLARLPMLSWNLPVFYTPNAYYGMGDRSNLLAKVFNLAEHLQASRGFNIHVSPEESDFARDCLRIAPDVMIEIPNAVDFEQFRPPRDASERAELRREFGLPTDALVIGSIGRISFQKDPETLYSAFARLREMEPELPLYLMHVGKGEANDERRLVRIATDMGIDGYLLRPANRGDPELFYRVMDAFCLSSRYEGLPFTALEALASNLPLILTDSPGLRSFGSEIYGFDQVFYAPVGKPLLLADAMRRWIENRNGTCNHRARANGFFSIPVCYGRIADLYRRATE